MNLDKLKSISRQSYDISLVKNNSLKKADSDQILVYQNHIFKGDPQTICLVSALASRYDSFFLLDANSNPVEITDGREFLDLLLQKNQSALNTYHQLYQKLKNKEA